MGHGVGTVLCHVSRVRCAALVGARKRADYPTGSGHASDPQVHIHGCGRLQGAWAGGMSGTTGEEKDGPHVEPKCLVSRLSKWLPTGDNVDRSTHPFVCILMLPVFKCLRLKDLVLLRWNHEDLKIICRRTNMTLSKICGRRRKIFREKKVQIYMKKRCRSKGMLCKDKLSPLAEQLL